MKLVKEILVKYSKAEKRSLIEYVAIKRAEKMVMEKIIKEVQILHKLDNPHIIRFYDWYDTRNNRYCRNTKADVLHIRFFSLSSNHPFNFFAHTSFLSLILRKPIHEARSGLT